MEIINARGVLPDIYKARWCCKSQVLAKQAEIIGHCAWHGQLSGVESEEILQNKPVGSYVLRQGETDNEYYLSWISDTERTICLHRPFRLFIEGEKPKWLHKNGQVNSLENLEDIIPKMMHLSKKDCFPIAGN